MVSDLRPQNTKRDPRKAPGGPRGSNPRRPQEAPGPRGSNPRRPQEAPDSPPVFLVSMKGLWQVDDRGLAAQEPSVM